MDDATRVVKSLRECVELCATEQAVPPCVVSAAEEAFTLQMLGEDQTVAYWRGVYHDTTGPQCISGGASEYSNMLLSEKTVCYEQPPCLCEVMTWNGRGFSANTCDYRGLLGGVPCLCASPSTASTEYYSAVATLDASAEPYRARMSSLAATIYIVGAAIGLLLPSLLYACFCAYRFVRDRVVRGSESQPHTAPSSEGEDADVAIAKSRLSSARRAAASMRIRVSGMLLQSGFLLLALSLASPMSSIFVDDVESVTGSRTLWNLLGPYSWALMLLAIFPTDGAFIRVLCAIFFAFWLLASAAVVIAGINASDIMGPIGWTATILVAIGTSGAATIIARTLPCACCLCCKERAMPPRAALQRLWLGFRFFLAMSGPMPLVLGIRKALEHDTAHMFSLQALLTDNNSSIVLFIESASFLTLAAVTTPTNRGRLHRYLGSLGKAGTTKEAEAAAIAALVGGLPPERALDLATERFRALPLGKLTEEDVLSNSDTGLFGKTSKCALGDCDAFVSHSWHDPGPPKLGALHTWAAGEPKLLWLDKACSASESSNPRVRPHFHS